MTENVVNDQAAELRLRITRIQRYITEGRNYDK